MLESLLNDVKGSESFVKIEILNKGWSSDKKYFAETASGKRYLIRTADIAEYDRKKAEFENMKRVATLGIPVQQPVDFGTCNDGKNIFLMLTWIDGKDLEAVLPSLSETEQYTLGLHSGKILRKVHSIVAPEPQGDWALQFNSEIDYNINKYRECGVRFDDDDVFINFIERNRYLTKNRPLSLLHSDYSTKNMLYSDGRVFPIDFGCDFGDPWEDFQSIRWSIYKSALFASEQINGYFDGLIPDEFWGLFKLYLAVGALHNVNWAFDFGNEIMLNIMLNQAKDVLNWYHNMQNRIPTWYLKWK